MVKYHGPRPTPGANKVYVANHTSMIDFIILQQVCVDTPPGRVSHATRLYAFASCLVTWCLLTLRTLP